MYIREDGFTLLELLVSMTLVAIITVILLGSLRAGIRAREKGEKDIVQQQRHRIALDRIRRQLASIYAQKKGEQSQIPFILRGDNKSIDFVSNVALLPTNRYGIVYVRYRINTEGEDQKESLVFYEKNVALLSDEDDVLGDERESYIELIPEVHNIEFEYLDGHEDRGWIKTWDLEVNERLPKAVRIILKENEEKPAIYVIARNETDLENWSTLDPSFQK